jgi:ArsR family transcriptional regulator
MQMLPIDRATACCAPLTVAPLSQEDADQLAGLLKVVADSTRLRLLSLIASSPDGEVCVCDLTEPLGLSQPTISHHLKVLREAGVVVSERQGTNIVYSLSPDFSRRWAGIGSSLTNLVQIA